MGWPSRGSVSTCRVGQEMSRPCGQRRALASRRGRQGSTVLPRIRRAWTGPNDGAVRVANTHGCAVMVSGMPLPPARPGADELAGVALVHRRAGRADGLAAVAAGDVQMPARPYEGGEFAGGQVDHVGAAAELDRVRAGAVSGELAFPGAEVRAGVVRCRRRSPQVPSRGAVRDSGRLSRRSRDAAPALLGGLAGDAEPGADLGPGVAERPQAGDGLADRVSISADRPSMRVRASMSPSATRRA